MGHISVLVLLSVCLSVRGMCPDGFYHHEGMCYALSRVEATWAEALQYCKALGASLARIDSYKEYTFVKNWMTQFSGIITTEAVWLAGQDYLTEGEWKWAGQRDVIQKTWWHNGQPDNGGGKSHCLGMAKSMHFEWADFLCQVRQFAMCESPDHANTNSTNPSR